MSARELPEGLITLMFTDIEGSTRLLSALGDRYPEALADHRRLLREAFAAGGGVEVDTQGDAFFVAFPSARGALEAAVRAQRALSAHTWPDDTRLRVRMGLHTGRPVRTDEGYVGIDLHRGARICSAGHGGQIVVSEPTSIALAGQLPEGASLRALGSHRLKDLSEPAVLFDVVIAGEEDAFPPLASIGSRPTNLPSDAAGLIGRAADLASARALFEDPRRRLLTLTGPGGTGKTRLALALASELLPETGDGAFVVALAEVADPSLVATTVAQALGLRLAGSRSPRGVLTDYLAKRDLLLVLDNFEHLLEATDLVPELLTSAPGLRILVTSRVPLRVGQEQEFPVRPLETVSAAGPSAAAALFAERARAARPDFTLDETNRGAVEEICARLDGLPLAIELAAVRIRLLSPQAMLGRLDARLDLAAGRTRDAPARHQTMRAAIDWSHDLLGPEARRAFARLGVFAGAFTIEAAEAVCDISLDDLDDLIDQSLVASRPDPAGEDRLMMLETIRAYSRERLAESSDEDQVRAAHVAYFAALADRSSPELLSGQHEMFIGQFDAELDDLRAALYRLEERGPADQAVKLAGDLASYWTTRGHLGEGRAHLESTLSAAPGAPALARARAQFGLGRMAMLQGDAARAAIALDASLGLHRELGDVRGTVLSLSHLGWARAIAEGDSDLAVRLNEEALEVARRGGDDSSIAVALNNLAFVLFEDEPVRVRRLLNEALQLRRRVGDRAPIAITLGNLGELEVMEGRIAEAAPLLEEALSLARQIGFEGMVADASLNLARAAAREDDWTRAGLLLLDALPRSERLGDRRSRAGCLYELARVAARLGELAAARTLRTEAASEIADLGDELTVFEQVAEAELADLAGDGEVLEPRQALGRLSASIEGATAPELGAGAL